MTLQKITKATFDKVQTNKKYFDYFYPNTYFRGTIESINIVDDSTVVRKNNGELAYINLCWLEPDDITPFVKDLKPQDFGGVTK